MKRWLRQHKYACVLAIRRLYSQKLSSLANVIIIALMLCVPLLGAAVLQSSQGWLQQLDMNPELSLFLDEGLSAEQQQSLLASLQGQAVVAQAKLVGREQALAQLRADATWAQALDALPDNPLPDAIVVTLIDSARPAQQAKELVAQWRELKGVAHVQMDAEWVQRLESLLGFIGLVLALLSAAVVFVVLATVFNTVRLQALTQREEITVARLLGATEAFVRRPFLYQGALTGLLASILGLLFVWLALIPINTILGKFAASYALSWQVYLPARQDLLLAGLVVVLLGALAARFSVTRYTRGRFK